MVQVVRQLQHALKEWAIAVDALSTGKTIMLLRKGGIRERRFQVKHSPVWLYPTYEHQKPYLLKPEYASQVTPVESGWHPKEVTIKSCAEITETIQIDNKEQIAALQPFHIWNAQMIDERLKWKSKTPLIILLLRVYRLPAPQTILYNNAYGGCKSWIDLIEPITHNDLIPVLSDDEYTARVSKIKASI